MQNQQKMLLYPSQIVNHSENVILLETRLNKTEVLCLMETAILYASAPQIIHAC